MAFDLFPRTYKGKSRCVLRQKHALISSANEREFGYTLDIKMKQSCHVETVALFTRA
ncbi:hypothetical protein BPORC_0831 [Bifidobacterium porcinum]|nr:hypothetical protein BPORC_0831 [Bifidobacterium porcinum]